MKGKHQQVAEDVLKYFGCGHRYIKRDYKGICKVGSPDGIQHNLL